MTATRRSSSRGTATLRPWTKLFVVTPTLGGLCRVETFLHQVRGRHGLKSLLALRVGKRSNARRPPLGAASKSGKCDGTSGV